MRAGLQWGCCPVGCDLSGHSPHPVPQSSGRPATNKHIQACITSKTNNNHLLLSVLLHDDSLKINILTSIRLMATDTAHRNLPACPAHLTQEKLLEVKGHLLYMQVSLGQKITSVNTRTLSVIKQQSVIINCWISAKGVELKYLSKLQRHNANKLII